MRVLHDAELCTVLKAMLDAIVARGQAKEGYKTMIDSLAPAVKKYECLANGTPSAELCELVKKAAEDGAENTKNMEAIRGRASYQGKPWTGSSGSGRCYHVLPDRYSDGLRSRKNHRIIKVRSRSIYERE